MCMCVFVYIYMHTCMYMTYIEIPLFTYLMVSTVQLTNANTMYHSNSDFMFLISKPVN